MKAKFEKIPIPNNNSFHAFMFENEDFDAPWHFHPEYELTYIIKGKGIRYVGNSIENFEEGDLVLLGTNLPHCWKNTNPDIKPVKSIVMQFNENILGDGWLEKNEFRSIKDLLEKSSRGIKFHAEISKEISKELIGVLNDSPLKKLFRFLNLLELLSNTKTQDYLISEGFAPNLNNKINHRINTIYSYVHQNYDQKIALNNVASEVAMSQEAFCRFFKKSLNKSFFTFVNEYRIHMVCEQLIKTNKAVNQIAFECGYESLPFFYRQFKKFKNSTPLDFKKKYIKIEET
ncbi:transcriptional regulator, AraC family [Flavobacterium flevense]|uniref:AraC family transcriptional regulator n=1 Tax=Flavobacterium flevense TaxID=983 RepID=A0A4Y4AZJ7_9FLAO|nr:AraC family transcriptional regulator [Flavobacterium flevense]GEC72470.1 AraC family transcriptional regulator [Flavobacterium flevense]SHM14274.1 transcriptional regulator, AraC family [Flavobacterium flevense]